VPRLVKAKLNVDIEFDIGIASGMASTGLHGPEGSKQFTVFGNHPGVAKRLESEAAYYRKKIEKKNEYPRIGPIIAVTNDFEEALERLGELDRFTRTRSASSDTRGIAIYIDLTPLTQAQRGDILENDFTTFELKKII